MTDSRVGLHTHVSVAAAAAAARNKARNTTQTHDEQRSETSRVASGALHNMGTEPSGKNKTRTPETGTHTHTEGRE